MNILKLFLIFVKKMIKIYLSYLKKISIKYLKLFNIFFVSKEKNNPTYYYILIIQEAYKELFNNKNIDSSFGIFFDLLRP